MQLTKMSTSRISWNGPPLAVSSMSHFTMSSLKKKKYPVRKLCKQRAHTVTQLVQTDLPEKVNGAPPTSAKCTYHECLDALSASAKNPAHAFDHGGLVLVRQQLPKTCATLLPLFRKRQRAGSSTSKASMEPECRDTTSACVGEELEVVKASAASMKAWPESWTSQPDACSSAQIGCGCGRWVRRIQATPSIR